jgi:phosphatidyl-myo-inositol alpha-mannosyltransferase
MFHSTLPEPRRKPGGVEVFVHRLSQHLVGRGHAVTVFSLSPSPSDAGYDVSWPAAHVPARSKIRRLTEVPARLNCIDTARLDILHLHGDDWFFFRRRLPTVRTFYGSAFEEARHGAGAKRRASQAAIFGLEVVAARLATRSYGIAPGWERTYRLSGLLPCGVDVPEHTENRRAERPTILFVGTWDGRKRGRYLHEVFSRDVRTAVPDAQLWMVSDRCEECEGVRWIETPSDDELTSLYGQAWTFCLPSTYEGFGIPYIEAMAQGTPVVASPNPGAKHVLGVGRAGLIARDGELGGALVRSLLDEELRRQLSSAGRARAHDFAWQRVVQAHEAAYDETIAVWRRKHE